MTVHSRPQQGPRTQRQPVEVRISPAGLARVDDLRGTWTRSEYIRQAIAHAARTGLTGPHPGPAEQTGF